jgi:PAS domain S-box-containing protein
MPNLDKNGVFTGYLGVVREITDQKTAEYDLRESRYEINERLKELKCMYEIARLSKDYSLKTSDFLQRVCDIIPSGFQFENATSAKINYEGDTYVSLGYSSSQNFLLVDIETTFGTTGEIKVYLMEGYTFLAEESDLIEAIKDMVEQYLESSYSTLTLRHSEERLHNLVNSQTNYVLRTDIEGYHSYWNLKFAEDFGWLYEKEGMEGGHFLVSIVDYHHGRTLETVTHCIQNPGKIYTIELDKPFKGGGVRTTLWEFVCLTDKAGNPAEIQCMGIDVTDKIIAERELKKLNIAIEQSPVALLVTDPESNVVYSSPAFTKITGYEADEILGQKIGIFKSGLTPREVYHDLWTTIRSGKAWQWEWLNKKKNGDLYWENISITPMFNEDGSTSGYLSIKQDITERKQSEKEILELNQNLELRIAERTKALELINRELELARIEAENANHAKSEFLSRMSHELRTPMNAILGFAQLLDMGDLNPSQRKGVGHILRAGGHLLDLINEVLDISRIEAGRISMSVESVEIRPVVQEMLDTVSPLAASRKITLTSELPEDQRLFMQVDKQRLKQILLNFINNSIKYNQDGGTVWIRSGPAERASFIRLAVVDTGHGISEEDIPRIFNPFERINADQYDVEGTGLGLMVVKKLVDLMGGFIGVDSTVGVGSTFWVEFPMSHDQLQSLPDTQLLEQSAGENQYSGTVLYIEDNASNIELIEQVLKSARPGINMITSMYGSQAVKLAQEYKPDLILLDLNLPDIHGSIVFSELQAHVEIRDIPVVVISADAMSRQMTDLKKAGIKHYLTKPVDVPQFLRILDSFTT